MTTSNQRQSNTSKIIIGIACVTLIGGAVWFFAFMDRKVDPSDVPPVTNVQLNTQLDPPPATNSPPIQSPSPKLQSLKTLAEKGDAMAQFNLALKYEKGEGIAKNDTNAVKWYRKAAEQGHVDAQYHIGLCYARGLGVEPDGTQAYKWLRIASFNNHKAAKKAGFEMAPTLKLDELKAGIRLANEFFSNHRIHRPQISLEEKVIGTYVARTADSSEFFL